MYSSKELQDIIDNIINEVNKNGIVCAIRRNEQERGIPFKGDVDVLIEKKAIGEIIRIIKKYAQVVRIYISYGGIKIWITTTNGAMKLIDIIWRVSKLGIILMDTNEISKMLSSRIYKDGIPVLPLSAMGEMILAEKKTKSDYNRYFKELEASGLVGLDITHRWLRLFKTALRSPLKTFASTMRLISIRFLRLCYPIGLIVQYQKPVLLISSQNLNYIFKKKIYISKSLFYSYYLRNFLGGLVIVKNNIGDLALQNKILPEEAEKKIIELLSKKRSNVPKVLEFLA
jgi:hypothetical protein